MLCKLSSTSSSSEKSSSSGNMPSVRFFFWAFSLLPVLVLIVQLGPVQFAEFVNFICTVDNSLIPSSIVKNTSGYAVIDRLYVHQGTPYIVADSAEAYADAERVIEASCGPRDEADENCDLKVVTLAEAQAKFGWFIHKLPGVAFITTAKSLPSPAHLDSVLAGLWRTYESINPATVPRKLLLPSIDSRITPASALHSQVSAKSNSTPFLSVETKRKWDEWAQTPDPRRFERAVVAYRSQA